MPATSLSVFSEPDELQAALQENGGVNLLVSGHGKFQARLIRVALPRMRLFSGEERLARVAFCSLAPHLVRITLPMDHSGSLIWRGVGIRPNEVVTHGGGQRLHERTDGPCRWSTIWLSAKDLASAGHATTGATFVVPPGERRWRPMPTALLSLARLHNSAIRVTASQPELPIKAPAAHGLEQQISDALIESLIGASVDRDPMPTPHSDTVMARFEDVLQAAPTNPAPLAQICAMLGVSETTLRTYCQTYLGMSPSRYIYLRRMQAARRALRGHDPVKATVAEVARRHGFSSLGHFAAAYRALFGELPSATRRRQDL